MTAPSREDLDVTIDHIAADIVTALDPEKPGTVPASSFTALCAAGSFLLAYRAARTITEVRIDDVRVTRDAGSIAGTTGGGK